MRARGCFYHKEKTPFPLSQYLFYGNCTLLLNILCKRIVKRKQSRGLGIHFARCWFTGRRGRLLWHVICASYLNSFFCPPFHCLTFNCLKSICLYCHLFSLLPSLPQPPGYLSCDCMCCKIQRHHCANVYGFRMPSTVQPIMISLPRES
ncbi:hypothetical protein CI102_14831 [Trichoderma harzianum]|nr:hypothetical protein CI102_14831 [Trichoderma harzianum]